MVRDGQAHGGQAHGGQAHGEQAHGGQVHGEQARDTEAPDVDIDLNFHSRDSVAHHDGFHIVLQRPMGRQLGLSAAVSIRDILGGKEMRFWTWIVNTYE